MGIITLIIRDLRYKKSLPVQDATKYLRALAKLYFHLAKNSKEEINRDLKHFKLDFKSLNFSDATFKLVNPDVQQSITGEDVYSIPFKNLIKILNQLKKSNTPIETYKFLKNLVPNGEIRKKVINKFLKLCPIESSKSIIDLTYTSPELKDKIIYKGLNNSYRSHLRAWKSLNKSELVSQQKIVGVVRGIVTTTESPYILLETNQETVVKCFYTQDSFAGDFNISDLRVTEDLIFVSGTYIIREGSRAKDHMVSIKEIRLIKTDFDFTDDKITKEWGSISEKSFEKLYNKDQDLYKNEYGEGID
ncbi:MAG: hypothetical protein R6U96_16170 [Promethearchaeia archaeon]